MEELILLAPHNSFFALQYAETLATAGDLNLAYKQYLRVLEMCGGAEFNAKEATRQGPWTRALWGLKSVTTKLLTTSPTPTKGAKAAGNSSNGGQAEKPEKVEAIDALVTDLLLNKAYTGSSAGVKATRDAARKVLLA